MKRRKKSTPPPPFRIPVHMQRIRCNGRAVSKGTATVFSIQLLRENLKGKKN